MAAVRKTSVSSAPRGVIHDFMRARGNGPTVERAASTNCSGMTSEGRGFAALRIVGEVDELRTNRVRALREHIANGTYKPDPREVAKRLVQSGF